MVLLLTRTSPIALIRTGLRRPSAAPISTGTPPTKPGVLALQGRPIRAARLHNRQAFMQKPINARLTIWTSVPRPISTTAHHTAPTPPRNDVIR